MIGALAGDIIGSVYERRPIKTKDFPLFSSDCLFTDDSVLTVALADAILHDGDFGRLMRTYYRRYPHAGYGGMFHEWANSEEQAAYNSYGNGAAMRISPVGMAYDTLEAVLANARKYTEVTHNHPEGVKGAQAVASAIFIARHGGSRRDIKAYVEDTFGYDLSSTCDAIRPFYRFDVSCQGTVPQAFIASLESDDFEDAIRNAISLGGDSDTLACITGGIAEAYYGSVPDYIDSKVMAILDSHLRDIVLSYRAKYAGQPK
jgi:ADP-ribosylglycohydrolase